MSFVFKPAKRENTPLIVGLAGPSKSGKTYSALRLAVGLKNGGQIFMINTEGKRGHQYADKFDYQAVDLNEPFAMTRYREAMVESKKQNPSVLIIDSVSHAHEGIGGMLDQHESELDRMSGGNYEKRMKMTYAAWIRPKKDESDMINFMLQMNCHIILCFRAKEKIKIIKGKEPEPLGWQPIGSDRIHFETAFTLILPPHSQGTPDMTALGSEFREPYDKMVTTTQIDEALGKRLAEWSGAQKTIQKEKSKEYPKDEEQGSSLPFREPEITKEEPENKKEPSTFIEKVIAAKKQVPEFYTQAMKKLNLKSITSETQAKILYREIEKFANKPNRITGGDDN